MMRQQVSPEEFKMLKSTFATDNTRNTKVFLYHLGSSVEGQGVYSELGSMLECMCFCHINGYQFQLYADDCNFTSGHGFETFFEVFCPMDHHKINIKHHHRYPSPTKRRKLADYVVKKVVHANRLTSEDFFTFIDDKFQETLIEWPSLGISGMVGVEKGKLIDLAMHYNDATWKRIVEKIISIELPEHFVSVQMRGGDKSIETTLLGAEEYVRKMEDGIAFLDDRAVTLDGKANVFVFTDDYGYVEALRKVRPNWCVYTLAREDETGFYLDKFNAMSWEEKQEDMIKLFAMMEICYSSDVHFGYEKASSDRVIKAVRLSRGMRYIPI